MAAYEINLDFLVGDWYVPSEALADIYHHLEWEFEDITSTIISTCMVELYTEVQAIRYVFYCIVLC